MTQSSVELEDICEPFPEHVLSWLDQTTDEREDCASHNGFSAR